MLLPVLLAAAVPDPDAVHAALESDAGWALHDEDDGVTVYRKDVPGVELPAYKGVKVLAPEVDPEVFFAVVCDVAGQMQFTAALAEAEVLRDEGDTVDFYQVMKVPVLAPVARRYWLSRSIAERDVGGTPGHHRRRWSGIPVGEHSEARAALQERYPGSIELAATFGSWELLPQPDASTVVVYRTVSDPGGAIPDGLASLFAGSAIPENMLRAEEAARGRRP
jgi:hypothetical protein